MKLTKLAVILLLGVMLISGVACGGGQGAEPTPTPTPTSTPEHQTYTDENNGFSIDFPAGWQIAPDAQWEEAAVMLFDLFACNDGPLVCSLLIEELPYSMSVESFHELGEAGLQSLDEYTPISEEELNIGGKEVIKHVYTMMSSGQITYRFAQFAIVEDQTGYMLAFAAVPTCFDEHEDTFDMMADSFRLSD